MHSDGLFRVFPNQFRFVGESLWCPMPPTPAGCCLGLALTGLMLPPPGNAQNTLAQPTVWLTIALTTVVCIMPVVAFRFLKLDLKPELSDTVRVHGCGSGHGVLSLRRDGSTGP